MNVESKMYKINNKVQIWIKMVKWSKCHCTKSLSRYGKIVIRTKGLQIRCIPLGSWEQICIFECKMLWTGVCWVVFQYNGLDFDAFVDFVLALLDVFLYSRVFIVQAFSYMIVNKACSAPDAGTRLQKQHFLTC